ncbi:hypothetical protein NP493_1779g00001 [Ridgeia piscesae]|uniref:Uncharacterized protein n=1 Tax=Ridgeia piscesae TaxID=27915 RepID=A0AAD9JSS3_RIDPI|nr:hypothetical protein NP493_1779g00001 [Ridgeia piscesae]
MVHTITLYVQYVAHMYIQLITYTLSALTALQFPTTALCMLHSWNPSSVLTRPSFCRFILQCGGCLNMSCKFQTSATIATRSSVRHSLLYSALATECSQRPPCSRKIVHRSISEAHLVVVCTLVLTCMVVTLV